MNPRTISVDYQPTITTIFVRKMNPLEREANKYNLEIRNFARVANNIMDFIKDIK